MDRCPSSRTFHRRPNLRQKRRRVNRSHSRRGQDLVFQVRSRSQDSYPLALRIHTFLAIVYCHQRDIRPNNQLLHRYLSEYPGRMGIDRRNLQRSLHRSRSHSTRIHTAPLLSFYYYRRDIRRRSRQLNPHQSQGHSRRIHTALLSFYYYRRGIRRRSRQLNPHQSQRQSRRIHTALLRFYYYRRGIRRGSQALNPNQSQYHSRRIHTVQAIV